MFVAKVCLFVSYLWLHFVSTNSGNLKRKHKLTSTYLLAVASTSVSQLTLCPVV
ncbi:hypothetical protein B7P43_G14482 [Cryptotermes secundus]|uniref:Uncharacterized protein n=1 Tax=Cryptotermes secundus TaxID=105785 RepID=A0A2J7RR80_9NEOP|nr:hypothetical protein B7P43_G14482 [Cryptotermes secundus]